MNDRELESLLWEEVEGSLAAGERERLAVLMEGDGEASRMREEVAEVAALLATAEDVAPPAELRGRIRTAVAERPAAGPRRSEGRRWWSPGAWLGGPGSRYAYLAAGIVIGVVSVLLVGRGMDPGQPDVLVGTLGVAEETVSGEWQQVALADARGFVRLQRQPDGWAAAFDVSAGPVIAVRFVSATGEVVPVAGDATPLLLAGGGRRQLEVHVAASRLVVESEGRVLLERSLGAEPK